MCDLALTRARDQSLSSSDAYLEINPLICLDGVDGKPPTIEYLDMAAKLDQVCLLPFLRIRRFCA